MSQRKPDDVIEVEIELDELDLTSAESKATYAVVMTDMDGKELAIDCDRAEAQVVFDERRMQEFLPDLRGENLRVM